MGNLQNKKDIVSIIIPIYNTEEYLKQCIESVINQTYTNIEIICVNDCSSDSSLEILNEYALRDKRLQIINLAQNKGVSFARNKGLDVAMGEFIYFLDSDDYIDENYIEEAVNKINFKNADIVINANYVNEYKEQVKKEYSNFEFLQKEGEYPSSLVQRLFPPVVWARLYRKSFIKNHNIKFPNVKGGAEDIYFSAMCDLIKGKVHLYKGVYYHYLQRQVSYMKQSSRGFYYIEAFKMLYETLTDSGISTDNVKLFCAESLIVDAEEKYLFIKEYFNEIKEKVLKSVEIYNKYEMFVFEIITNALNYEDFISKYNTNTSVSFVRHNMRKNLCRI